MSRVLNVTGLLGRCQARQLRQHNYDQSCLQPCFAAGPWNQLWAELVFAIDPDAAFEAVQNSWPANQLRSREELLEAYRYGS